VTRRWAVVVVAAGLLTAGAGIAWIALGSDRLPGSVWVRPGETGRRDSRAYDMLCVVPGGATLGADWTSWRPCGLDGRPSFVMWNRGEPPTSVAWMLRLFRINRVRCVTYEYVDNRVRHDGETWIEYVRKDG
jgi:hypothetical protein